MLPRSLVYLEATCLNWTQVLKLFEAHSFLGRSFQSSNQPPDSERAILEQRYSRDNSHRFKTSYEPHRALYYKVFNIHFLTCRPQGKLILPSSLHTCNITSWRFRFKPDKLVHLAEASNLRELHLKDCYVVSGELSIEFSHLPRFNELLALLSDLFDAH